MPRPPTPRYYPSRDAWYAQVDGHKVLLAHGKAKSKEAWAAFHRLMAGGQSPRPGRQVDLVDLAERFLDDTQKRLAPLTYEWYRRHLQSFVEAWPKAKAEDLRPHHVQAWLDRHPDWSDSTRHGAITAAKRLTSWGRAQGFLDADRLAGMPRPGIRQRAAILAEEDVLRIFDATRDQAFRDLLTILRETGCRPSEAYRLEAGMVDLEGRAAILVRSKTSGKTGRPRVIFLTARAVEVLERAARTYPDGPILRNTDGRPWTRNAIALRFRSLRKRLGLGPGATAEAFRHGYATDALERGVPIATVAELLGHRGTRMVEAYYSHLYERREHLRQAAENIRPDEEPTDQGP